MRSSMISNSGGLPSTSKRRRRSARREVLVEPDVLPAVAEIFRRERASIGPFVPFANAESEDPVLDGFEAFEDIGLKVELFIEADQPRIAVDGHQTDIFLAADESAHHAAVPAGLPSHRGDVHDARRARQAVGNFGQALGFEERTEEVGLPVGGAQSTWH